MTAIKWFTTTLLLVILVSITYVFTPLATAFVRYLAASFYLGFLFAAPFILILAARYLWKSRRSSAWH